MKTLDLGEISVDVIQKDIKNVHLSVHPPTGRIRIAAPEHMAMSKIKVFAISKMSWIRKQQEKLLAQPRETKREYLERESHHLWDRRYLLNVTESDAQPRVTLKHTQIELQVRKGTSETKRRDIIEEWYREQLKAAVPELLEKWQPLMGVEVEHIYVQRMKTKWGGCNPSTQAIRLNTELAKKPKECLEYILVHEMVHLLEPTHNQRFRDLMDQFMPQWQHHRNLLNQLPIRHEEWIY